MKQLLKPVLLLGLMVVLAMPFAFGDSAAVTSTAAITNVNPSVGEITATDPVTLSEGTTTTVWCNATVTDDNGYADVTGVTAKLWDPATSTEGGTDDYNKHYTNSSCAITGGSGTTLPAKCAFSVHYSANAAEWTCNLTATDASALTGSNVTDASDVTVNQLKALSTVSANLAFGELAFAATSADKNITVTNTGNALIDVSVDGYGASDSDGFAMTCTTGTIPLANMKYNLTAAQLFGDMTALTDDAVTLSDFNLAAETTDDTASSEPIYWKLKIPDNGVKGSCAGNVVVTAI